MADVWLALVPRYICIWKPLGSGRRGRRSEGPKGRTQVDDLCKAGLYATRAPRTPSRRSTYLRLIRKSTMAAYSTAQVACRRELLAGLGHHVINGGRPSLLHCPRRKVPAGHIATSYFGASFLLLWAGVSGTATDGFSSGRLQPVLTGQGIQSGCLLVVYMAFKVPIASQNKRRSHAM